MQLLEDSSLYSASRDLAGTSSFSGIRGVSTKYLDVLLINLDLDYCPEVSRKHLPINISTQGSCAFKRMALCPFVAAQSRSPRRPVYCPNWSKDNSSTTGTTSGGSPWPYADDMQSAAALSMARALGQLAKTRNLRWHTFIFFMSKTIKPTMTYLIWCIFDVY